MWVRERLIRLKARTYFRTGHMALQVLYKTGLPAPKRPWNFVHVASSRAAKTYDPPPSSVRIDYFRPQTGPEDAGTPWDRIARGGVTLHQVIGPEMTHENVTKGEGAPTLVEHLTPALEKAMNEAGAPATNAAANGHGEPRPVESVNGSR